MKCAECGRESRTTELCSECGAPVIAASLVSADPESAAAVHGAAKAAVLHDEVVTRPPVRRTVEVAGAVAALVSAVFGVFAFALFKEVAHSVPGLVILTSILLPGVVAVVALIRIDRLVVLGLLQGMFWPSVAWLAFDITYAIHRPPNYQYVAGNVIALVSDALGAAAAVLLLVSWGPAISWRFRRPPGYVPVVMVCAVAAGQIAVLIFSVNFYQPLADGYVLGIIDLLVGIAAAWYGATLRDAAAGGALVLGWAFSVGLVVFADRPPGTHGTAQISATVACWLFGAVAMLALIHAEVTQTEQHHQA